ncbi:ATP-dependent DNA helicase RecQ [Atopobacter sp. AH10]|uniref:RecQ family ATP-dependent DNA helicase n=1 Tax=Atopobacter sp. AH10 TaxID=2315861 RepID=UPI000EF2628C|nr:RecQ family ATP-dependent DNA helicase [Atopobacter sp. AH10]RLK63213.1 ATP-dependent DNA helicase RecQ [Atopobacter sp. AH10]
MDLNRFLKERFHYQSFRKGQEKVIKGLLAGKHILGIFPTGYGKTLLYQFIGAYQKRPVVIFSPLKALMIDQVNRQQRLGLGKAVAISSMLTNQEKRMIYKRREDYRFFYLSPEMAKNSLAKELIASLKDPLLVVDEAHCISQWGRDFRPEYMDLLSVRKDLNYPQTLALTATATPQVIEDVKGLVYRQDEQVTCFRCPNEEKQLHLAIIPEAKEGWREGEKEKALLATLKEIAFPVLIYTAFRKKADQLAQILRDHHYLALSYHAGLSDQERYKIQDMFLDNQIDCVVATSAFGMGIDKANIRTVIHFHPSQSIEAFIQESGRAGRDGLPCQSISIEDQAYLNWLDGLYRTYVKNLQENTLDLSQLFDQEGQQLVYEFYQDKGISPKDIRQIFIKQYQYKNKQLQMVKAYLKGIEHPEVTMQNYLETGKWIAKEGSIVPIEKMQEDKSWQRKPIPIHWKDRFASLYGKDD